MLGAEEQILQLPAESTAVGHDLREWMIAPGSAWIGVRFMVPGSAGAPVPSGFAGLRVKAGKLSLPSASPIVRDHDRLIVPPGTAWKLSLTPEPAVATAGLDAAALAITP